MGKRVRLVGEAPKWTEARVCSVLAYGLLNGRSVLVVPNCTWAGGEKDLLVIEPGLRIIDVEVKISRSDLKADIKKDKWWKTRPWSRRHREAERTRREWPDKVWKHYYAMPASIWAPALLDDIPACSGVILLHEPAHPTGRPTMSVVRRSKPNKDAKPIGTADAIDLARLASLRMWSALNKGESA